MNRATKPMDRERGGVIVTFAILLVLLMGFMGLAVDMGHLFVIRSELHTAMDACALAGAQELDGLSDSLTRAKRAGVAAGNANRVNMQSATWSGQPQVTEAEISFFDKDHNPTTSPAGATGARYVRCSHTQAGTETPLLKMFGSALGSSAFAGTVDVGAFAEATTTPSQTTCPVPLGLKPKPGFTTADWGFAPGEWVTLLSKSTASNGQIGWANLDGSSNASETEAELNGFCGTRVNDKLGTPGVQQTISDVWNARFGIYKNGDDPSIHHPDFTGAVYVKMATSWPTGSNALSDFMAKRQSFASCAATIKDCEDNNGLKLNAKSLATPGANGEMQKYGTNRRLVVVPVVDSANTVKGFACMLMLQPLSNPLIDVQLEYVGDASIVGSPCPASGLPGGTAGPLVPVLVR